MELAYTLSLIVASTSLIGLLFGRRVEGFVSKYSVPVIGVSVGILAVTIYHLGFEAFEEAEFIWYTVVALLGGLVFAEVLHRFSHETHCHHGHDEHSHGHGHDADEVHACAEPSLHGGEQGHHKLADGSASNRVLAKIVAGDSVHNLIDGFTLAAVSVTYPLAAIPLAASMFLHESVQEVAEFLVLKEAGVSKKKAVFYNVLSGLSIVVGVFLGLSLSFVHEIAPYLAGFSAGILVHFMVYDGLSVLFGKTDGTVQKLNAAAFVLAGAAIGFFLLGALTTHIHV